MGISYIYGGFTIHEHLKPQITFLLWPHCFQVVSCYETSLPHSLDPFTLDTRGVDTFNGVLKLKVLAAHFRLDVRNMVSHKMCSVGKCRWSYVQNGLPVWVR